jgi:hypothetical protein
VYRMREFDQTILRGSRWNEPVDAGAFKRLLLIDEYDGDLWHEECPNLIQIIEGGLGDAFQQCKERLLCPELGLKEGCLRLSGIRTMILALKNPNDDSVARRFMAAEIGRRVYVHPLSLFKPLQPATCQIRVLKDQAYPQSTMLRWQHLRGKPLSRLALPWVIHKPTPDVPQPVVKAVQQPTATEDRPALNRINKLDVPPSAVLDTDISYTRINRIMAPSDQHKVPMHYARDP